jgi:enediyne polyketide synthase
MEAAGGLDLLIEVGPGRVLTDMVKDFVSIPAIAIDAGGPSLKGLLQAAGAAFALGATVHFEALFEGRFTKPFDLEWKPRFLANPCEAAPLPQDNGAYDLPERQEPPDPEPHAALADEAGGSTLEMFRQIVAARAELPPSAVADDARLLDDLHLNSITVSQLVVEAARKLNLPPPAAPTDYATVTVAEAAKALDEIKNGAGADIRSTAAPGVDSWVRAFVVNDVESPLPPPTDLKNERGWRIISADDHPLRQALHKTFIPRGDGGVVVCLPPEPDEKVLGLLLDGARAVLNDGASYFILVQQDNGAASFAKTLHLEAPDVRTCVVNLPFDHPNAVDWLAAEAKAVTGFSQAHYDSEGVRRTPVLELLPLEEGPTGIPLDSGDVLLVTGGGKGITAECAFDLAMATGARLALMGRSDPARDADLRQNLERFNAAGVNFLYLPADVSDSEAVRGAVRQFESALGPITAFLHGAGVNEPRLLKSIDESSFLHTLEPKLMGARNVLAAIDPRRLKLFISFGSLIARAGMRGEGEYAVANEWLTALSDRWQKAHPHCRCVMIEWSVWSGIGMGERLGRIEALMQQGITAIPPDAGMSIFRELLSSQFSYGSVVVTGRFGRLPTLKMREIDLPLLRFLEQPLVVYPGVELVADAELSTDSDPYLSDHVFQGDRLLPGVIGLEAMAQAVTALAGKEAALTFEKVEFNRPVVVPEDAKVRIRLAALARDSCRIDVALRSEQTGFQVDHFRASCLVAKPAARSGQSQYATTQKVAPGRKIDLDPGRDLYGSILFHEGRFHRLRAYHHLAAKECFAEIAPDGLSVWFGQYLPAELILGDPGALDATIHAIQACIPHEKLLPVGVDRLHVKSMHGGAARYVRARERTRTGDHFVYDVEVIDETGGIASIWTGLRLRLVGHAPHRKEWSLALLAPYLERKIEELFDGVSVAVRLERFTNEKRRSRTRQAITRLIGDKASVRWRPDGKPLVVTEKELRVSSSHSGEITMVAAGAGAIGCDIESVTARAESDWKALLGPQRMALARLIARECGEEIQASCTRAWSAVECLKKAGSVYDAPLVMRDVRKDGWVVLGSGYLRIATQIVSVTSHEQEYALALLVGSEAQADKSAFA